MDEDNRNTPDMAEGINRPAKPGWLFLIGSFVVYGVCIMTMSMGSLALYHMMEPCALMNGIIFFVPATVVGGNQYRAIFRRRVTAARSVGRVLVLAGGICLALGVPIFSMSVLQIVENSKPPSTPDLLFYSGLSGVPLAMGVFCWFQGTANRRWANVLDRESRDPTLPPPVPRYQLSIREMLGLMTVVAMIAGLTMTILKYNRF